MFKESSVYDLETLFTITLYASNFMSSCYLKLMLRNCIQNSVKQ